MLGFIGIGRHGKLQMLLSSYVDGQVSGAESAQVERHLAECAECRQELDELKATVQMVRQLPELELPRSFVLASVPEAVRPPRSITWVPALATSVAGVLLAALLLGEAVGIVSQEVAVQPAEPALAAAPAVQAGAALKRAEAPEEPAALAAAAPVPEAAIPLPAPARAASAPETAAAAPAEPVAAVAAADVAESVEAAAPLDAGKEEMATGETVAELEGATQAPPLADGALIVPGEPGPAEAALSPGLEETPEADGAVSLPLRQLELAVGILVVLLVAATAWSARRSRRWNP